MKAKSSKMNLLLVSKPLLGNPPGKLPLPETNNKLHKKG